MARKKNAAATIEQQTVEFSVARDGDDEFYRRRVWSQEGTRYLVIDPYSAVTARDVIEGTLSDLLSGLRDFVLNANFNIDILFEHQDVSGIDYMMGDLSEYVVEDEFEWVLMNQGISLSELND